MRQLAFAALGYVLMISLMSIDYHAWQKERVIRWSLAICFILLLVVFTQPAVNGARRWLRYGPLSFQPSEIAKLALLLFMAYFLHRHGKEVNRLRDRLVPCLGLVGLFVGLIAIEPDLGQAACITGIVALLLFLAGLSWWYVAGAFLLAVPAFYFGVVRVPFRWERIRVFLNPFHDPLGAGWSVAQSLTAIGSGGITGLGLGGSKQKLFFLPEAHSDFIFAVIAEELGFLGAGFLVLLFCIFFYRGLKITSRAPDAFGFYLGLGITLLVVSQAFINISMVLSLLPTKGMALPFVSQGGSSLMLNMMATGLLLSIARYGERA
jgi:cell division protein FtsW